MNASTIDRGNVKLTSISHRHQRQFCRAINHSLVRESNSRLLIYLLSFAISLRVSLSMVFLDNL